MTPTTIASPTKVRSRPPLADWPATCLGAEVGRFRGRSSPCRAALEAAPNAAGAVSRREHAAARAAVVARGRRDIVEGGDPEGGVGHSVYSVAPVLALA